MLSALLYYYGVKWAVVSGVQHTQSTGQQINCKRHRIYVKGMKRYWPLGNNDNFIKEWWHCEVVDYTQRPELRELGSSISPHVSYRITASPIPVICCTPIPLARTIEPAQYAHNIERGVRWSAMRRRQQSTTPLLARYLLRSNTLWCEYRTVLTTEVEVGFRI